MSQGDSRNRSGGSPSRRTDSSYDSQKFRSKKKVNKGDSDRFKKFPLPNQPIPPGMGPLVPPNPNSVPMLLPGMPLPPSILMNMPLPPPGSDPSEIKKALKMIMSNFPPPGKDPKLPFFPPSKKPVLNKKRRSDPVNQSSRLSLQDTLEMEVDKRLKQSEKFQEAPIAKFLQIPGLLSRRHLKNSTIDEIERYASREKFKVNFLEYFDPKANKPSSDRELKYPTTNFDRVYSEYKSLGLGKVECVLPFSDGLD